MGWRLGCRIFCGKFNQNVIWESDPWHIWPKSRGTKKCSTHHAHIDGASIQLDCIRQMLPKATHKQFVVARYGIYGVICMIFQKWHVLDLQIL